MRWQQGRAPSIPQLRTQRVHHHRVTRSTNHVVDLLYVISAKKIYAYCCERGRKVFTYAFRLLRLLLQVNQLLFEGNTLRTCGCRAPLQRVRSNQPCLGSQIVATQCTCNVKFASSPNQSELQHECAVQGATAASAVTTAV